MKNKILFIKSIFILTFIHFGTVIYSSTGNSMLIFADVVITSNYNGYDISCVGASDGSATVYPTGGQAPYEYVWSNGFATQEAFGLSAGTYFVTITDATFSSLIVEVILSDPPPIIINISQTSSNSLEAIITGGVSPYTILWSTGDTGSLLNNLSLGTYTITVTDANGCSETANYNLSSQTTTGPDWNYTITNENHTIFIPDSLLFTINGDTAEVGDMIGVFYDSLGVLACGGYILWTEISTVVVAYGDDPLTTAIDGFYPGEEFQWKVWDISEEEEYLAEPVYNLISFSNDGYYFTNGISGLSALIGFTRQEISIPAGWSIMSTYVDPFLSNFESVFSEIIQDVIVIKNEDGELYYPAWNLNMIGDVTIGEGYQIKMINNGLKTGFILYVNGEKVDPETGIELPEGWSIISYLHKDIYPIVDMMAGIDSVIVIVKNGDGDVYIPNYPGAPIDDIHDMIPGDGYKIKILAGNNVILFYPDSLPATKANPITEPYPAHKYFAEATNTGSNHSFIFTGNAISNRIKKGDEVGLFVNDRLVGSRIYMNRDFVLPAFGNDKFTTAKDGAFENDKISIRLWKTEENLEYLIDNIVWLDGDDFYKTDKISIIDYFELSTNELILESLDIYPNPNNGKFSISERINNEVLKLELSNAEGKILFFDENITQMQEYYDFSNLPSGVYYIRVTTNNSTLIEQFIIQ